MTDEAQIASGKPKGVIRITSSVAFAEKKLIPLLLKFKQTYPDLKPELILTDENLDLTTNRIDLALRLAEGIEGDYVVSRLQTTKYHVCAAPSYLDQHSEVSQPNDLSKHECLVFSMPEFRSSWFFQDSSGNVDETEITPGIIISNALALRKAALAGLGPALLADWLIAEDLANGSLLDLFPQHKVTATSFDTGVWFVYPSRHYLPNKVRVTIDFLRENLT